MTQPAKAHEPSMEEILASIRRIIADDDSKPAAAAPRPAVQPLRPIPEALRATQPADEAPPASPEPTLASPPDDVLELTEAMAAQVPPPAAPAPVDSSPRYGGAATPRLQTIDGHSDVVFHDAAPEPEPAAMSPPPPPLAGFDRGLLSQTASSAVDQAFNTLAHSVLTQNAPTLEDLVREMLRPMLKDWLDDNLPGIVERLVRAEIERVSRSR